MTFIETDSERLDALLRDLEARAFRPGQIPYQGMQELGQFVEEVHTALGYCLGFDSTRVHIDAWHSEMAKHGYECHAAQYSALNLIYGYRNIASHPNEEKHSISHKQVRRRFDDISESLPDLLRRLTRHAFVDRLFEVQVCSLHQRRAETLRVAIVATGDVQDYLPVVFEYALPFIPEKKRGFLKAPANKQLQALLTCLGRLCSTTNDDVLSGLAKYLLGHEPLTLKLEQLCHWLSQHGTPLQPGTTPPRLRVIRLTLDRDPRSAGGLLVRHATVVEPVVPGLVEFLPEFPIPAADLAKLYEEIIRLLNSIRMAMDRAAGPGVVHHWQDFVLEVEVPADLAATDFEFAGIARPGRDLTSLFRCITIRPLFDYEALQPLRGIDRPIVHPRHDANSVAVWATSDPARLYRAAQGRDCLFTGPAAWRGDNSVPPIVQAFEGFPSAVVCQVDGDIEGLAPLYLGEDQRHWPELLDRVTALRRSGASLKVLWNDPDYETVLAESV